MKEKKQKSEIEDESSKPIDEDLVKKGKKKGSKSKCSYCSNIFHLEKTCFKNNMDIISQLLEKHNIQVRYELENPVDSLEHCHSA